MSLFFFQCHRICNDIISSISFWIFDESKWFVFHTIKRIFTNSLAAVKNIWYSTSISLLLLVLTVLLWRRYLEKFCKIAIQIPKGPEITLIIQANCRVHLSMQRNYLFFSISKKPSSLMFICQFYCRETPSFFIYSTFRSTDNFTWHMLIEDLCLLLAYLHCIPTILAYLPNKILVFIFKLWRVRQQYVKSQNMYIKNLHVQKLRRSQHISAFRGYILILIIRNLIIDGMLQYSE